MLGWELPPHNSGGLGVACHQLCKALTAQGAAIEFILPYHMDEPVAFMQITSATDNTADNLFRITPAYGPHMAPGSPGDIGSGLMPIFESYESTVRHVMQTRQFDIIHAHDWLVFRAALEAKRLTRLPLIVHVHSIEADRAGQIGGGNDFIRDVEATGLLLADQVVAVSQRTKEAIIREYGVPSNKIEVLHNSLDVPELIEQDDTNVYAYLSYLRAHGYHVVTNVGRLTMQKGLPNLLRAAQRVIEYIPKTVFLIVGDGEQYYELISLAADLGILSHVIFTGFQRGKAWRDAFLSTDLFVMPSLSEPFGLTPLEALYHQVPSLISHQSGVSEILHNCLKVDFWDTEEMANQIIGLLRNTSLRTLLLENATQELAKTSWQPTAKRLMSMYGAHAESRVATI